MLETVDFFFLEEADEFVVRFVVRAIFLSVKAPKSKIRFLTYKSLLFLPEHCKV